MQKLKEWQHTLLHEQGLEHSRVLLLEVFLLHQLKKIHGLEQANRDSEELKKAKEDVGKLVTRFSVFFTDNVFGAVSTDMQPQLWAFAQKYSA